LPPLSRARYAVGVPEVSRFFGITIRMFYNDHQPAHFHAIYGSEQALLEIDGLRVIRGSLPPRVLGLVIEWAIPPLV